MPTIQLRPRTVDGVAVLDIAGRFDNYNAAGVAQWLEQASGALQPRVIVNLAEVEFIDSTALATLVRGHKRCQQRAGELCLCGLQPQIYMIFELARLDRVFTIYTSVEHALQTIGSKAL